jgi:nucleoside-diphosphate kinase
MNTQSDAQTWDFKAEWYDQPAQLLKKFTVRYFTDGSIQINDDKTKRTFLKKMECPGISIDDFFLGATIPIYGRQFHIVDYANRHTMKEFEQKRGRAVGVVLPAGYNQMGEIIIAAREAGMIISKLKMTKLTQTECRQFDSIDNDAGASAGGWYEDTVLAIEVVDNSDNLCAETWYSLCSRINRKHGRDIVFAPQSTYLEQSTFFFGQDQARPSTAVYDNCTLAIIRPEAVKRGAAGPLIDRILQLGLEIAGMEMYQLSKSTAEDFFGVYKGVLNEYSGMIENMTGGDCIALCIRGENIVNEFRAICGPVDVEIARELEPKSLRAIFGVGSGSQHNAIHCTDLATDGELECQFFFDLMNQ